MKERKGKIARFPPSLQTPAGAIWCWLRPSNRRWRWISGMLVESVKQVGWTMANCMNRRRQVDKCHSRIKMGAIWPQILHIIAKRNKAKQKSQTKSSGNSTTVLSPRLPSACHLAVAARRYHRQLTSIVFFNPIPAGIWISLPPPPPSRPLLSAIRHRESAIGNPPSGIRHRELEIWIDGVAHWIRWRSHWPCCNVAPALPFQIPLDNGHHLDIISFDFNQRRKWP